MDPINWDVEGRGKSLLVDGVCRAGRRNHAWSVCRLERTWAAKPNNLPRDHKRDQKSGYIMLCRNLIPREYLGKEVRFVEWWVDQEAPVVWGMMEPYVSSDIAFTEE